MLESFDTAVFVPGRGLYAFADDLVWRYADGRRLPDAGFPKPITAEFPGAFARALDAAVVHPDGGLYLFRGDQHIRYDVARRRPYIGYPRRYADDWPGVFPNGIDAALTWSPDIIYFFSGGHYTSFSPRRGHARVGFPKAIHGNWSGLRGGPLRAAMNLGDGRRLLLADDHYEAYNGDGGAIGRHDGWPLANSAVVEHEDPFRTGIPNALKFDSKLWDAFKSRLPLLKVNPGFTGLEDAAMVIVALSGNPADPRPYVGHDATRMFYSGSMLKVAAMYAAFQLRAAVNRVGESLTDSPDAEVFNKVKDALDKQIRDAVPRITSAPGIRPDMLTPKYAQIFTITHGSPVKFAFTDWFRQNLRRMIVGSHNESAMACIRALGYNTINGALQRAGLFSPTTDNGIWLAGDYANWQVVTVKSDNDGQVKQATTCFDMARLLVLINDDNLVEDDVHTRPDTGNVEMRGLLEDAVTDTGARTLLLRSFEPDTTTAPFKVLQSKIGVGQLKGGSCRDDRPKDRCTYSEAAVVQNSAGRKFVVVFQNLVLFKAHPSNWHDGLRNITKVISETIEAFHP